MFWDRHFIKRFDPKRDERGSRVSGKNRLYITFVPEPSFFVCVCTFKFPIVSPCHSTFSGFQKEKLQSNIGEWPFCPDFSPQRLEKTTIGEGELIRPPF